MDTNIEWALAYAAKGFKVFPLHTPSLGSCSCGRPDCENPGKHPRISKWQELATDDEEKLKEWWSTWPDANIALHTDGLLAVDVDRKGDRDGTLWLDAVDLPQTPTQYTPTGGCHLLFDTPDGFDARNTKDGIHRGVDTRGTGGYILVEPSIHPNGSGYSWEDSPLEHDLAQAPEWLLHQIGTRDTDGLQDGRHLVTEALDDYALADISAALEYINPDGYEEWLRVGMSIHSRYAHEQGYQIWTEWSKNSSKFDERNQRYVWSKFDSRGGVELSTLFYLAKMAGYDADEAKVEDIDVSMLWDPNSTSLRPSLEDHQISPTGFIGDAVQWILETAPCPQPELALGAVVSMFSAVFSRRFSLYGVFPNSYVLNVAASGAGKDHPQQCVEQLLHEGGWGGVVAAGDIGSAQGIETYLRRAPIAFFPMDEASKLISRMSSGNASTHEAGIKSVLMEMYSKSKRTYRGRLIKGDGNEKPVVVKRPAVNILASNTPTIWDVLQQSDVEGGFLGRCLLFDSLRFEKPRLGTRVFASPPPPLVEFLEREYNEAVRTSALMTDVAPNVVELKVLESARRVFDHYLDKQVERARGGGLSAPIWARLVENAQKLALIKCLTSYERAADPVVTARDALWACEVSLYCTKMMSMHVDGRIASTRRAKDEQKLLDRIRATGSEGLTLTQMRSDGLDSDTRRKLLKSLQQDDLIVEKKGKGDGKRGRKKKVYLAMKLA